MKLLFEILAFVILIFSTIASCKNEGDDENIEIKGQAFDSSKDSTISTDIGEVTQIPTLYVLSMNSGEFVRLANRRGDNDRRLVFQFCYSASYPNKLTLKGWPGKGNGRLVQNASGYILTPHSPDSDSFGNEFFLGQQKLQKDSVRTILNRINNDTTKFVIFNPEIDATTKQVAFSIYVVNKETFEKGFEVNNLAILAKTNPSPPASSRDNQVD